MNRKLLIGISIAVTVFFTAGITYMITSKHMYKEYQTALKNSKEKESKKENKEEKSNENSTKSTSKELEKTKGNDPNKVKERKSGFQMSEDTKENEDRKDRELAEFVNTKEGKESFIEEICEYYLTCTKASAELTNTHNFFILPDTEGMYLSQVLDGVGKLDKMSDDFYNTQKYLRYKKDAEIPTGCKDDFKNFLNLYSEFIKNFNEAYTLNKGSMEGRVSLYSMNEIAMDECSSLINNDMYNLIQSMKNKLGVTKDFF